MDAQRAADYNDELSCRGRFIDMLIERGIYGNIDFMEIHRRIMQMY
jgi:hypothetical protein